MVYVKWEIFLTERSEVVMTVFDYSVSKEYTLTSGVAEYNNYKTVPVYDFILGCNNIKEFGVVQDLQTNRSQLMKSSYQ